MPCKIMQNTIYVTRSILYLLLVAGPKSLQNILIVFDSFRPEREKTLNTPRVYYFQLTANDVLL